MGQNDKHVPASTVSRRADEKTDQAYRVSTEPGTLSHRQRRCIMFFRKNRESGFCDFAGDIIILLCIVLVSFAMGSSFGGSRARENLSILTITTLVNKTNLSLEEIGKLEAPSAVVVSTNCQVEDGKITHSLTMQIVSEHIKGEVFTVVTNKERYEEGKTLINKKFPDLPQ
jgi:hypothetical protein